MDNCIAVPASVVGNMLMCTWGLAVLCGVGALFMPGKRGLGVIATLFWIVVAIAFSYFSSMNIPISECSSAIGG